MRQNYKLYLAALLLVGAVSMMTIGAQAAPKLAVLVVGVGTDAASDAFATGIGYEVTQKGLYELVNNDAVKAKLTELRNLHKQNKTVDTVGLAAWGKEKGLDFVQLVVESDCSITIGNSAPVNGREQLAQVVSCGTAKYTGRPTYRTRFVPHSSATLNLGTGLDEMVFIVGGVFQMATNYYVELSNFYIGKYEVTQALWKKVMGTLPSSISGNLLGDDKPVVYVSWNDIVGSGGFLEKLKAQTGKSYRLPTEAEWEYAARGCNGTGCEGFEYSGSNTLSDVGWYPGNCSTFQPVGKKRANRLGTYDMSGNVWEWCGDWYGSYGTSTQSSPAVNPTGPSSGSYRAIRGGSYNSPADESGAAHRFSYPPSGSDYYACGFRLVLSEFR